MLFFQPFDINAETFKDRIFSLHYFPIIPHSNQQNEINI